MKTIKNFNEFNQVNEVGPRFAAAAMKDHKNDERTKRIKRDTMFSLYSEYINRNLDFVVKYRDEAPVRYKLIDVITMRDTERSTGYNYAIEDGRHRFLELTFMTEEEVERKELILVYDIKKDYYNTGDQQGEHMNGFSFSRYFINTLIKIAKKYRDMYYSMNPVYAFFDKDGKKYLEENVRRDGIAKDGVGYEMRVNGEYITVERGVDKEATDAKKRSMLTPRDFNAFVHTTQREIGNETYFGK
jgi:hypothetical protein